MANLTLQLTIPAAAVANLSVALPTPTGGAGNLVGQPPVGNIYVQRIIVQNNSAHSIRYGFDNKVSTTVPAAVNGGTAGRGIVIAPGAISTSMETSINYSMYVSDYWIAGTPGDVIDILAFQ